MVDIQITENIFTFLNFTFKLNLWHYIKKTAIVSWKMAAKNSTIQSPNLLTSLIGVMSAKSKLRSEGICEILVSFVFTVWEGALTFLDTDLLCMSQDLVHLGQTWEECPGLCTLPNLEMQQTIWSLAMSCVFLAIKVSQRSLKECLLKC